MDGNFIIDQLLEHVKGLVRENVYLKAQLKEVKDELNQLKQGVEQNG